MSFSGDQIFRSYLNIVRGYMANAWNTNIRHIKVNFLYIFFLFYTITYLLLNSGVLYTLTPQTRNCCIDYINPSVYNV